MKKKTVKENRKTQTKIVHNTHYSIIFCRESKNEVEWEERKRLHAKNADQKNGMERSCWTLNFHLNYNVELCIVNVSSVVWRTKNVNDLNDNTENVMCEHSYGSIVISWHVT